MHKNRSSIIVLSVLFAVGCGGGQGSGRTVLQNKGSDTLVNVAQAWAEAYQSVNPNVAIAVTGGGSGTGIAALINGTVDLANSSRQMKDSEIELARKNGNEPIEHIVGYDALAVFVHPDNPMDNVTMDQLAQIYGDGGSAENWSDIGLTVPGCQGQEIIRVSRQNNSGTYAYFREAILGKGDFKLGSRDMHGSKDVVDLVQHTVCAIGYSGLAYATETVKMPCVSKGAGEACVYPTSQTAIDGSYPIARPLFMYTLGEPTGQVKEYLDWILSDEGQCIIADKGYAPARPVDCGGDAVAAAE
ncbi:MAG: PstS family phosphate ABC transporter substrate-binding protein [Rhodothermales bacterium]|nr:PstS family phosphate ABC transporter substrate-binding protein [Rhodothermales bacterium]